MKKTFWLAILALTFGSQALAQTTPAPAPAPTTPAPAAPAASAAPKAPAAPAKPTAAAPAAPAAPAKPAAAAPAKPAAAAPAAAPAKPAAAAPAKPAAAAPAKPAAAAPAAAQAKPAAAAPAAAQAKPQGAAHAAHGGKHEGAAHAAHGGAKPAGAAPVASPAAKPAPTVAAQPAPTPAGAAKPQPVSAQAAPPAAAAAAATAAAKPAKPGPVDWTLDAAHSRVGFVSRHLGFSKVEGQFKKFAATIKADSKTGKITELEATADTGSIDTGIEKRDTHLKSDDFFNAAQFPQLKIVMKKITWAGNKFTALTDLTIRDVTKPVTFKGEFLGSKTVNFGQGPTQRAGYEATAKINRKDFGLKYSALTEGIAIVGDEVTIELQAEIGYTAPPAS